MKKILFNVIAPTFRDLEETLRFALIHKNYSNTPDFNEGLCLLKTDYKKLRKWLLFIVVKQMISRICRKANFDYVFKIFIFQIFLLLLSSYFS